MSKAVMLSIQPKWCELIASGKKTIELRKTAPKLETPFKCYIYCTASDLHSCLMVGDGETKLIHCCNYKTAISVGGKIGNGNVIGEFVCDMVDVTYPILIPNTDIALYNDEWVYGSKIKDTCLTLKEVSEYGKGKPVYGWHISDLKIYDKPRELGEFKRWNKSFKNDRLTCPPQSWGYVEV